MDERNPENFNCSICGVEGLKWISLDGHLKSKKHLQELESHFEVKAKGRELSQLDRKPVCITLRADELSLYFKLTQFILENRLSFSTIEPLINIFKELLTDFRVDLLSVPLATVVRRTVIR